MTRDEEMLEYAPKGLIAVLTPQANTTVEPEFAVLCPPGYAWINARLTSDKPTIEERLLDYAARLEQQAAQFANAPIDVMALGTTGTSYLLGTAQEDQITAAARTKLGVPLITAGIAVCAALELLDARRIGLVSPYPESLTAASTDYWQARGFQVAALSSAYQASDSFHPIYSLTGASAASAQSELLAGTDLDAVVLLGTGMPTLAAIRQAAECDGPPVVSSMLALVWRCVASLEPGEADRAALLRWIGASDWSHRLDERCPQRKH